MAIFKGAGVALATPFKENGEVNYEEFEKLIEFQIANGTDAIMTAVIAKPSHLFFMISS